MILCSKLHFEECETSIHVYFQATVLLIHFHKPLLIILELFSDSVL